MRLPDDTNAYTQSWKYVETAVWRWNPMRGEKTVVRDKVGAKEDRKPKFIEWNDVDGYSKDNGNVGIYTSIFRYNKPAIEGTSTLGSLYFDFDASDIERARIDAAKLYEYFTDLIEPSAVRAYFTGAKGFHIECEALALGISPSNELAGTFRYIANDLRDKLELETIDFAVYDRRRMWRLPGSEHQKTGLYKRSLTGEQLHQSVLDIQDLAREPFVEDVPEQAFSLKGNEWYREYIYRIEEDKKPQYSPQELIDRFNKHGTGVLKEIDESSRQFNPKKLLESCHSITDLWKKAETTRHLEHEERLFLLSILSYTDESLFYLHEILRNCDDYNFEKSQAHIDDWMRRREMDIGGRPYTCRRANEAGVGCMDCNLESKKKWVKIGDSWVESDEEANPSPIRFAYDYGKKR